MTKAKILLLVLGAVLIGTSVAALVAEPAPPAQSRKITAGGASVLVPFHLPGEVATGTPVSGSVVMGSKDECDVTYDRFTGIYWSDRKIPGSLLRPTPAYENVSEQAGTAINLGNGKTAETRIIKLSAEKPCGKIVQETLTIIDLYCSNSRTHFAVVGMQDPFMTPQRIEAIAKSLHCS